MASLGLKLFYLRTREKKLSQREVAEHLNIRQATVSNLEQEVSAPHWALVVGLCQFYDVTPTYLADENRGIVPLPTERWGLRNALLTLGMWLEVDRDELEDIGGGKVLCQLPAGGTFYDDEAAAVRRRYKRPGNSQTALLELRKKHLAEERQLEASLRKEIEKHPRRRSQE